MTGAKTVRALREHEGPDGMVLAGTVYERSAEDAAYLVPLGVVEIVGRPEALPPVKRRKA